MNHENAKERKHENDRLFYIKELRSEECFCGRWKQSGYSFCYGCYRELPRDMQAALYRRMGEGYELAYEEAVRWLIA